MRRIAKRYAKAELIAMLDDKCPDALSQFPAPSEFEFDACPDGNICTRRRNLRERVARSPGTVGPDPWRVQALSFLLGLRSAE